MIKKMLSRIMILLTAFVISFIGFYGLISVHTDSAKALTLDVSKSSTEELHYSDGATYQGETMPGGIRHGTGTFVWNTGEVYSGEWDNDVITGKGKLEWPGLGIYEGEFVNGKRQGKGTFTWVYDNEASQGQPISYTGDWENDQISGKGTMVFYQTGTYKGEFVRQNRNGEGIFTWLNGDIYNGKWSNDRISGAGELKLADGTLLVGTFYNGTLNNGTVTYAVYGGTAQRAVQGGNVQANVTVTYTDGTVLTGRLNKDEFYGNVTIQYKNGDKYVGELKNGKKSGNGSYTWKNGAHYNGAWANDKMSGNGKYCYTKDDNKSYLQGTFKNGYPDGTVIYVNESRIRYTTTWSNGACKKITYTR